MSTSTSRARIACRASNGCSSECRRCSSAVALAGWSWASSCVTRCRKRATAASHRGSFPARTSASRPHGPSRDNCCFGRRGTSNGHEALAMASHGNHGRRVPGAGRGAGSSDGSAHSQPDTRADVVRPFAGRSRRGHFPNRLRITPSVSGPTGRCWVTHWAISWTTTPSYLTRHHFPDPSYESDFEDYLVRKYGRPDDRPADREWPGRGRSCGAVTGAPPVSTADRVHRPRCAAASSEIDRLYLSVCHERVAGFGAAGASRHTSRVRRVRRITAGCMERKPVSLAGARAAARRGVHLLARTLRACVDRSAGGAAGALHCLSGHAQFR